MKKYLFPFILATLSVVVFAQSNDPVIMKINGKDVKKSEFEYIYNKNNNENAIDKKSFDEYVTLFKNFKLKVAEAEAQGLDTTAAFHKELNEYRSQLAKPYLAISDIDEKCLKEEYERGKNLVEISNLLILFPEAKNSQAPRIFPADTLEAYKKALLIRERCIKGEKFEDLVSEYTDDPNYKQGDRPGYVGWVSGLRLPSIVLEQGIYSTPAGKISQPIRTSYGYHLVKVWAKKPDPGEIHAAHILISLPNNADTVAVTDAQNKMDTIYAKLKEGLAFEELAKEYSNDPSSAAKGGELPWFGQGTMIIEFNDAAFDLKKDGDISKPVRTRYGFHIIKLLGKRPFATYENKKSEIQTKLERSGYSLELNKPTIDKWKKNNGFSFNENALKPLLAETQTIYPTDSAFIEKFADNKDVLFKIGNQTYTVGDFTGYLAQNKRTPYSLSMEALQDMLKNYEYNLLMQAEDKTLEDKYPEFKNLLQEYHDGTLLFEVSNKEVWEKSSTDTTGLKKFFETNKAKYAWNKPHYKGYVVLIKEAKDKVKMQQEIANLDMDAAAQYLIDNYKTDENPVIKIEKGLFTQGENQYVDEIIFHSGKAVIPEGYSDFFLTGKYLPDMPESYTDVRGLVITDYQDYLENEWINNLNKKYPVTIYEEVTKTVKR